MLSQYFQDSFVLKAISHRRREIKPQNFEKSHFSPPVKWPNNFQCTRSSHTNRIPLAARPFLKWGSLRCCCGCCDPVMWKTLLADLLWFQSHHHLQGQHQWHRGLVRTQISTLPASFRGTWDESNASWSGVYLHRFKENYHYETLNTKLQGHQPPRRSAGRHPEAPLHAHQVSGNRMINTWSRSWCGLTTTTSFLVLFKSHQTLDSSATMINLQDAKPKRGSAYEPFTGQSPPQRTLIPPVTSHQWTALLKTEDLTPNSIKGQKHSSSFSPSDFCHKLLIWCLWSWVNSCDVPLHLTFVLFFRGSDGGQNWQRSLAHAQHVRVCTQEK